MIEWFVGLSLLWKIVVTAATIFGALYFIAGLATYCYARFGARKSQSFKDALALFIGCVFFWWGVLPCLFLVQSKEKPA